MYHLKKEGFCICSIPYTSHWDNQLCLYVGPRLGAKQTIICIRSMSFHYFKIGLLESRCCMWIKRKLMLRFILCKLGTQAFSIVHQTMAGETVTLRSQNIFSVERELTWWCPRGQTISSCPYSCISSCIYATICTHYVQRKIPNI